MGVRLGISWVGSGQFTVGQGFIYADPIQYNLDAHDLRPIQSINMWY